MTTQELDQVWNGMATPTASLDTRFTFSILLEAAAAHWHPERMANLVAIAGHTMDRTPGSAMYGNLAIAYGAQVPTDPNVGLFCMESAVITWEGYRSALSSSAQSGLYNLLQLGASHVQNYAVGTGYTNIYLLKAFDCIALGEILGNTSCAALGYGMLESWITATKQAGIGEFLSPTYYGVDLEAMALTERMSTSAVARDNAISIQNLIWADIAAHWFEPTESCAGSHSRDHDYLMGHGKSDIQLQLAGWLTSRTPDVETFPDANSTYFQWARSQRPIIADELRNLGPHTVVARSAAGQRTTYLSSGVSLSSTSGSYCLEDKLLNIHFSALGPQTVNMCYVMDGIGDPYGQLATANALGNSSVQHLTPQVLSQQYGPQALYLVSEELPAGSSRFNVLNGVHSDIILPQRASIWSGNSYVPMPAAGQRVALSTSQPVFIHFGSSAVAVRVLAATTTGNNQAGLYLVNDGSSYGACRLLCEHASAKPQQSVSVRFVMHVTVADGLSSNGFTAFRQNCLATQYSLLSNQSVCDVAVLTNHSPLHLTLNVATNQPIFVGGVTTTHVLDVNGSDIGTQLLDGNDAPTY